MPPLRQEGPALPPVLVHTPSWTPARVAAALQAAFRAMPYTPIYAPRGNTLLAVDERRSSADLDVVAFSGTVLGDRSEDRKILLVWARAIVTEGEVGGSIAQFCAARDMNRRTFDRRRVRACERIAAALSRIDSNGADVARKKA